MRIPFIYTFILIIADSKTETLCPSICHNCHEQFVQQQAICRIHESSDDGSQIYETGGGICLEPLVDDGLSVWGSGEYVAHSKTHYTSSALDPLQLGESTATHIATYSSDLDRAYVPVETSRSLLLTYKKGDSVYELSHGKTKYIMMIRNSIAPSENIASGLALNPGWSFKERVLSSDLHVYTPTSSSVVTDDLGNLYTSVHECEYHYHQHSSLVKGLNWAIGISFLIILCCAASFLCIRLYYLRRKRLRTLRKRKLVKSGAKVKKYQSTQGSEPLA